jgi:hypothetical protein
VSTIKHLFFRDRAGTTPATHSGFSFRNRSSETIPGQLPSAETTHFWAGDWRLAIAEERVAVAEERLAQAMELAAKAK